MPSASLRLLLRPTHLQETIVGSLSLAAGLALVAVAPGCTAMSPLSRPRAAPPLTLQTQPAMVRHQDLQGFALNLPWEIHNPTAVRVTVKQISWTLTVNDQEVASGMSQASSGPVAPGSTQAQVLAAQTQLPPSQQAGGVWYYQVTAVAQLESVEGAQSLNLTWHGELLATAQPQVQLQTQAARHGRGGVTLDMVIGIHNPNGFALPVSALDYEVEVGGHPIAAGSLAHGQTIAPGAELRYDLTRYLTDKKGKALAKLAATQKLLPYQMKHVLTAGGSATQDVLAGELTFD